ncbi:MAG: ABC transporter, partial [Burkholderiaceae bacterium]
SMALNSFEGSVLLVSQDRALLREVCDEFWLVARSQLQPFDGDLDDYQRWLAEEHKSRAAQRAATSDGGRHSGGHDSPKRVAESAAATTANRREDRKAAAAARQALAQRTRPLKDELERLEVRLGAIETERAAIEARMVEGSVSASLSGAEIADAGRALRALGDETLNLETRWLELSERLQAIEQAHLA